MVSISVSSLVAVVIFVGALAVLAVVGIAMWVHLRFENAGLKAVDGFWRRQFDICHAKYCELLAK